METWPSRTTQIPETSDSEKHQSSAEQSFTLRLLHTDTEWSAVLTRTNK